jgi:ferrous iron transport protein A
LPLKNSFAEPYFYRRRLSYANLWHITICFGEGMKMIMTKTRAGQSCIVREISGDARFMSRVAAIGLTPGCPVEILRNEKRQPILLYGRDTMIALSRREGEKIMLEADA